MFETKYRLSSEWIEYSDIDFEDIDKLESLQNICKANKYINDYFKDLYNKRLSKLLKNKDFNFIIKTILNTYLVRNIKKETICDNEYEETSIIRMIDTDIVLLTDIDSNLLVLLHTDNFSKNNILKIDFKCQKIYRSICEITDSQSQPFAIQNLSDEISKGFNFNECFLEYYEIFKVF